MKTILELGLFQMSNNKILCLKLAERLDNTVSRSAEINEVKTKMLRSCNVSEEIRVDNIKEDKIKRDKIKPVIHYPENLNNDTFKKKFEEWTIYRKELKKPLTTSSINKQLKLLSDNSLNAIAMIDNSITNGWQGLFAPKGVPAPPPDNSFAEQMEKQSDSELGVV